MAIANDGRYFWAAGLTVAEEARRRGHSPATEMRRRKRLNGYRRDNEAWVVDLRGADGKWRPSRRLDNRQRDLDIRNRRVQGASFRAIAAELGWSVGTVHRVVVAG